MSIRQKAAQGQSAFTGALFARLGAVLAALVLAFTLSFGLGGMGQDAYAAIYPANDAPAATEGSESAQSPDGESAEDGDAAAPESESEEISEDATALSPGLGGGEPISRGLSFGPAIIAGIVLVLAFFYVLIRRQNKSINDMNRMFK